MKILTQWLRLYLPSLTVDDRQLAEDLTLRGIAVEGIHPVPQTLGGGSLYEMDITTNRVDAMNHYGIAREAAAIYDLPFAPYLQPSSLPVTDGSPAGGVPVEIAANAQAVCGRFTARVLRGISIVPSSGDVQRFFDALGQKRISNAVDASNFTLLGMGHPTHAFDLDKIEGGIVVRLAHPGERLRLLDGTERTLEPDDLVIADHARAISLAGVMGGWDTRVTEATRNILVEAAWFEPATIRRSSRRHLLHTDASHRYERGADLNACGIANALVSELILHAGGSPDGPMLDLIVPQWQAKTAGRASVALSTHQVRRVLGTTTSPEGISSSLIERFLTALGCTLQPQHSECFAVQLPSWRLDLEREIDLIEEVARVYGYNGFANTLPTPGVVLEHPHAHIEASVRQRLLALGYTEALSSTFASEADGALFGGPGAGTVAMENPLSDEARLLRPSLTPGMLTMLSHNLNRDVRTARLFEQGQIFTGSTAEVHERASLSLGLTGAANTSALFAAEDAGFYELKGAVEALLALVVTPPMTITSEAPVWLEAGRCATIHIAGKPVAVIGELAGAEAARRKLKQPIWLAEVDLELLYSCPSQVHISHDLSTFQAVERDFSFVLPDAMSWSAVSAAIHALAIAELISLKPVEVFRDARGKALPAGHHALLLRCVFQSTSRTLTEEDLTGWSSAIVAALTGLGGSLRA